MLHILLQIIFILITSFAYVIAITGFVVIFKNINKLEEIKNQTNIQQIAENSKKFPWSQFVTSIILIGLLFLSGFFKSFLWPQYSVIILCLYTYVINVNSLINKLQNIKLQYISAMIVTIIHIVLFQVSLICGGFYSSIFK